ncbi:hypothetical protein Baya_3155 [Bagarius yarrelli]|uniref:Uncharacterized protein n=1 Tax=Bagarius yarrelli TaxID=175774 RepID=A0A556TUK8_BAGYA|nr:hypothetical protein Baya_3155 [Bagarius yarrelli]
MLILSLNRKNRSPRLLGLAVIGQQASRGEPFIPTLQCEWLSKPVRQREKKRQQNTANPAHIIRVGCSKIKRSKSHRAHIQLLEQNPQEEERVGHGEKSALARLTYIGDIVSFYF